MMAKIRILLTVVATLWASSPVAQELPARIALVVGNAAYENVTALDNPVNDARLIGDVLETAGFKVSFLIDATQAELNTAIVKFGRDLRELGPDTVGLFYYAGHGVQSLGKNFLLPVDAALSDAAELDLVGIEADVVLRQMGSAQNETNIVILDACRNNPFAALEGLEQDGLAEMKASPGTFLSYSTGPGDVALDGLGRHSPFSKALAQAMQVPGVPIEQTLKSVRIEVVDETRGIQTPWDTSLLTTDFVFFEDQALVLAMEEESKEWQLINGSGDLIALSRFLRVHPKGRFAPEAREQLRANLSMAAQRENQTATPVLRKVGEAPEASDQLLFEAALASGQLADYEAYLQAFPKGTYAELVRLEVAARDTN